MVLFHSLRGGFYMLQGMRGRAAAVEQYRQHCQAAGKPIRTCPYSKGIRIPMSAEAKTVVYMGLRTNSHVPYNHVNNARFAEAMEFSRWYSMGLNDSLKTYKSGRMYPTIQSININYLAEMPTMTRIVSRFQYWGPTEDAKAMTCFQQLESVDGSTIYSTGIARIAWLNMASYRLPDGSKPKGGALNVAEALDRHGLTREEVSEFMSFKAPDGIEQAFGPLVSSYDTIEARIRKDAAEVITVVPTQGADITTRLAYGTSLRRTYVADNLQQMNSADKLWRSALGDAQRSRRDTLRTKSKSTPTA